MNDSVKAPRRAHWGAMAIEVVSFRELKEDWDGDGCLPPTSIAIDKAIQFIAFAIRMGISPEGMMVLVGQDENIHFERNAAGEHHLNIEVLSTGEIEMRVLGEGWPRAKSYNFTIPPERIPVA